MIRIYKLIKRGIFGRSVLQLSHTSYAVRSAFLAAAMLHVNNAERLVVFLQQPSLLFIIILMYMLRK